MGLCEKQHLLTHVTLILCDKPSLSLIDSILIFPIHIPLSILSALPFYYNLLAVLPGVMQFFLAVLYLCLLSSFLPLLVYSLHKVQMWHIPALSPPSTLHCPQDRIQTPGGLWGPFWSGPAYLSGLIVHLSSSLTLCYGQTDLYSVLGACLWVLY